MAIENESLNKIFESYNYDEFKFLKMNRPIDTKKVNRFAEEAKRNPHLMGLCPILVNSHLEILDGQHRFLACKQAALPIYYIKSNEIKYEDIIVLNKDQKNWGIEDYINFHIQNKNINFIKLNDFRVSVGLSISLCLLFLGFNQKDLISNIKHGTIIFPSDQKKEEIKYTIDLLKKFQFNYNNTVEKEFKGKYSLSFRFVQSIAFLIGKCDMNFLFKKLTEDPHSIIMSNSYMSYIFQYKSLGYINYE